MKHANVFSKLVFTLALLMQATLCAMAQNNPKTGCIINNAGDTVRGTIDFRTDSHNSRTCLFKADGAAEFNSYGPEDIRGYRLDDGAYYVARSLPVGNETKTFFAEYLVQGSVSLFHHKEGGFDYYYLVDNGGRTATIREGHDLIVATSDRREAQRQKLAEAGQLFGNSPKTQKQLWDAGEMTIEKLVRIVSDYNKQDSAGGAASMVYKSGSNASSGLIVHPRVEAGLEMISMSATAHNNGKDLDLSGTVPAVGVGLDLVSPRLGRNIVFQVMAYYSPNKATGETKAIGINKEAEVKYNDLEVTLGAMYRFIP